MRHLPDAHPRDFRWVLITAQRSPDGQLPTDIHHLQGRIGCHYNDPSNLIGLSRYDHMRSHGLTVSGPENDD